MAFNPDQYLASKKPVPEGSLFDPDAYLASKADPVEMSGGQKTQAALEGFGQGVGAGYLPQMQAGVEKVRGLIDTGAAKLGIGPETPEMVNEELRSQGFTVDDPAESYVADRDQNIKRQANYAEQAPYQYYGGQVGGIIASAPAVAKQLNKIYPLAVGPKGGGALGLLGRSSQAAAGGAIQGAIQNPGDAEGVVDLTQIPERIQNAKTGAALGAVAQVGTEAIKKGAQVLGSAPKAMERWSQGKAFKSAGAMLKDFRRAFGKDRVEVLGQEMFDSGLAKPGMTFKDVAEKSSKIKEEVGNQIGAIYDKIGSNVQLKVDAQKLGSELINAASDSKIRPTIGRGPYDTKIQEVVSDIVSDPTKLSDIRHLNDLIGQVDDHINHAKTMGDLPAAQQGLMKIRQHLRNTVNQIAEQTGRLSNDPKMGKKLLELNKRYGNLSEISTISKDRVARESANQFFSLTDKIAGVGGAAAAGTAGALMNGDIDNAGKGLAIGAGFGLLNKGSRLYGGPIAASAANKAGRMVQSIPPSLVSGAGRGAGLLTSNPGLLGVNANKLLNQPKDLGPARDDPGSAPKLLGKDKKSLRKPAGGSK
jgi:hypothetical protein